MDDLICGIFTVDEWNGLSEDEQIALEQKYDYDMLHEDQKEWLVD